MTDSSHPPITLPYGRQHIDDEDIDAVVAVLKSDYLTTGPCVEEFENKFARTVGARHAVALSSGTAALHAALQAAGVGPGQEVIVPPMTFVATANAAVYLGARPVFADVLPETLLIDPAAVECKITPRTRAIIAVDYAGQPCDYDALLALARRHGVPLIADSCHALGATWNGRTTGSLADFTVFSFHPVKHITTGEGGMVTTAEAALAERIRRFRNHGICRDAAERARTNTWFYDVTEIGQNYRLTDFQCALGMSQLNKLARFVERRREIARRYDAAFGAFPGLRVLPSRPNAVSSYHLYTLQVAPQRSGMDRDALFRHLRSRGIGVNVHYVPVHLHSIYRKLFSTGEGLCPVAETAYRRIISLPLFPSMTNLEVDFTIQAVVEAFSGGSSLTCP